MKELLGAVTKNSRTEQAVRAWALKVFGANLKEKISIVRGEEICPPSKDDSHALALHEKWCQSLMIRSHGAVVAEEASLYHLVKHEPAKIREIVLALVEVRGISTPKITTAGDAIFFIQDTTQCEHSPERNSPFDPIDKNGVPDVYRWDLLTGEISCVTSIFENHSGVRRYAISGNGDVVTFVSWAGAGDLYRLAVVDCKAAKVLRPFDGVPLKIGESTEIPENSSRQLFHPSATHDGQTIIFGAGVWENTRGDPSWHDYRLCAWNRKTGALKALSPQTNILDMPTVSGDGTTIIFQSTPDGIRQTGSGFQVAVRDRVVYLFDQVAEEVVEIPTPPSMVIPDYEHWNINHPNAHRHLRKRLAISDDGKRCVFTAEPRDVTPDKRFTQLYLFSRESGEVTLLSAAPDGAPALGNSYDPVISGDGNFVVFTSDAENLPGRSAKEGIWIYSIETNKLEALSLHSGLSGMTVSANSPSLNYDGTLLAFIANTDVMPGIVSGKILQDVTPPQSKRLYVYRRKSGTFLSLGGRLDSVIDG